MLSACVSQSRRQERKNKGNNSGKQQKDAPLLLPSIRRSSSVASSKERRRSSPAPLADTEVPHGVVLAEEDYADSDDDFVRVKPLAM